VDWRDGEMREWHCWMGAVRVLCTAELLANSCNEQGYREQTSSEDVSVAADRHVAGVSPRRRKQSELLAERKLYAALTERIEL